MAYTSLYGKVHFKKTQVSININLTLKEEQIKYYEN